jgi:hypothetical protein
MPDSLQRVNPILADVPDGRSWEGNNQGRKAKKSRGDRRDLEANLDPVAEDEKDIPEISGRLDVRI